MICKCFENVIHAEITVGQFSGKKVFLPPIPLSPAENEGYPIQFKEKQFPITLCFAVTINKAQGQTIPYVEFIYLNKYSFMDNYISHYLKKPGCLQCGACQAGYKTEYDNFFISHVWYYTE